jgi:hypothetical protein|tara:strand:- start:250 stop:471 length:222 start_codon:yes stop_codon:yes gene_type:complete
VHDALELEKLRIPSVVLVSHPFESMARSMATLLGAPKYGHAFIGHPTRSLNRVELLGRARDALPQVEAQLTAT